MLNHIDLTETIGALALVFALYYTRSWLTRSALRGWRESHPYALVWTHRYRVLVELTELFVLHRPPVAALACLSGHTFVAWARLSHSAVGRFSLCRRISYPRYRERRWRAGPFPGRREL
jgi:hypothetical protein